MVLICIVDAQAVCESVWWVRVNYSVGSGRDTDLPVIKHQISNLRPSFSLCSRLCFCSLCGLCVFIIHSRPRRCRNWRSIVSLSLSLTHTQWGFLCQKARWRLAQSDRRPTMHRLLFPQQREQMFTVLDLCEPLTSIQWTCGILYPRVTSFLVQCSFNWWVWTVSNSSAVTIENTIIVFINILNYFLFLNFFSPYFIHTTLLLITY